MPSDPNHSQPNADTDLAKTEPANPGPAIPRPLQEEANLEDAFSKLFKSSVSGTGEEELLRIASDYALQIHAKQIKALLYIESWASRLRSMALRETRAHVITYYTWQADYLSTFVFRWLDLKRHNNSDIFVMRGLDSISLRKFINENTLKVNIEK